MAKNASLTHPAAPAGSPAMAPPGMPPLPPTAQHEPGAAQVTPAEVAVVPTVDVAGVPHEAHPVGTAQYIADLETEIAQAQADVQSVRARMVEGLKGIATEAITHAARMAGHLPADTNAIPGIDAINAAGQA